MKINWFHVLGFTATAYYLWKVLGASISKCIVTAEVTLNGQADLVAVCLHLTTYLQMPRKKMKTWERESERAREKLFSVSSPWGKRGANDLGLGDCCLTLRIECVTCVCVWVCVCAECVFTFVYSVGWSSEPRCFITSEFTLGLTGCDE